MIRKAASITLTRLCCYCGHHPLTLFGELPRAMTSPARPTHDLKS